jgi:hypothetical protein
MIRAYMVGISNYYEGEDIEVRYVIFDGQELVCRKSLFKEYKKPLVVNHVALLTVLPELKKYRGKEIVVVINDASLDEQIRGISQTKKTDVLKMAGRVQKELDKFGDSIRIENVSKDSKKVKEWNELLSF